MSQLIGEARDRVLGLPPATDRGIQALASVVTYELELKLASGASPGRRKDLGDVQELVRPLRLPAAFAEQLHPSVRATYHQLWTEVQEPPPI